MKDIDRLWVFWLGVAAIQAGLNDPASAFFWMVAAGVGMIASAVRSEE